MFLPFDVAARQSVGSFEFNFLYSRCSFYLHDRTEQIASALEEINKRRGKKTNLDKLKQIFAKHSNAIRKKMERELSSMQR